MCISGAWGFVDHIAIALFHVTPTRPCREEPGACPVLPGEKLARVASDVGTDLFLAGRQLSLDARTLPRVLLATRYDAYLEGAEWNAWVNGADWAAHFPAEAVLGLLTPEDRAEEKHLPAVSVPGGEEIHGLLIRDADFVFPFGLLMIAFRFLLRALLALTGQVRVDPNLAHEESEVDG
jgi:hypothetical protein